MTAPTFSRLRTLADPDHRPALSHEYIRSQPGLGLGALDPAPRILLLYGSLRERSYSRLVVEETARLLQLFGCETRIFDPSDLPLPDLIADDDHPEIGRAHVCTPVTTAHLVCRLLLEKKNKLQ